jgi:uncharacterized protein YqhQ
VELNRSIQSLTRIAGRYGFFFFVLVVFVVFVVFVVTAVFFPAERVVDRVTVVFLLTSVEDRGV